VEQYEVGCRASEAGRKAQGIANTEVEGDAITMDFILGLPKTPTREDSI
jgi:hypothetical protein